MVSTINQKYFRKYLLRPKTNVVTALRFRIRFFELVLMLQQRHDSDVVFQCHYNFLFPKICNIA